MFISGNRFFFIHWDLQGRIWILWVIKPTLCPKFTELVFHIEGAFWFPRSLRIFCLFHSQWWNFLMGSSWVFVYWVVIFAPWCKFTITEPHIEGTFWSARPLRVIHMLLLAQRTIWTIHMLLLAQRPIWTICWTTTVRIIWSRWPVWVLFHRYHLCFCSGRYFLGR